MEQWVERIWKMMGGRKFLAWAGSSGLLIGGQIASHDWLIITLTYIGGQAAVDAMAAMKGKKKAAGPSDEEEKNA